MAAASPLVAQARDVCATGPGVAYGIVAYQCANCVFKQDGRPVYSFFAEPVVLEVNGKTGVSAGDIVEAVNGQPITTSAGAEAFAYPATGTNTLTIRRGRDRQAISVSVSAACGANSNRVQPHKRYVVISGRPGQSDPVHVVDGVVVGGTPPASSPPVGRFGFAFTCEPQCTASTGRDGPLIYTYYSYRDFPPITAIGPGSAAERAGLKVGDIVVKVEGHSVLDDEGAKGLARLDRVDALHLTVRRDGKEIDYTLKLNDKSD